MAVPFAQTITIDRYTDGGYVNGLWVDTGTDPISVQAHVQPDRAEGGVMLQDSNGARWRSGRLAVFSESELYTAETNPTGKADRLTWEGATYEITSVAYYNQVIPHWSCMAELIDGNVI
jgi:hypothetical protein